MCKLIPDGSTACECPRAEECPDINDPVCGTNGKTYESECKLKAESCAEGTDVTTKHNGVCGMKITSQNMLSLTCSLYPVRQVFFCSMLFSPGPCSLSDCEDYYGICTIADDGSGTAQCTCPTADQCSNAARAVCGDNAKTYRNKCFLEAESCALKYKIEVKRKGQCSEYNMANFCFTRIYSTIRL